MPVFSSERSQFSLPVSLHFLLPLSSSLPLSFVSHPFACAFKLNKARLTQNDGEEKSVNRGYKHKEVALTNELSDLKEFSQPGRGKDQNHQVHIPAQSSAKLSSSTPGVKMQVHIMYRDL